MRILVIGDHLSKKEAESFSGPWSERYARWFLSLLPSSDVICRNISSSLSLSKFQPDASSRIRSWIKETSPDVVLLCGPEVTALAECCPWAENKSVRRGRFDEVEGFLFDHLGVKAFPIPHPRDCFLQKHYLTHLENTIMKLNEPEIIVPAMSGELSSFSQADSFVFDLETPYYRDFVKLKDILVRAISVAWRDQDGTLRTQAFTPDQGEFYLWEKELLRKLSDPSVRKINHNIFYDLHQYFYLSMRDKFPFSLRGKTHCTMQFEKMTNPDLPASLGATISREFVTRSWKGDADKSGQVLREYASKDTYLTYLLWEKQRALAEEKGSLEYWEDFRESIYEHTFEMACHGMKIDIKKRASWANDIKELLLDPFRAMQEIVDGITLPQPKVKKRTPENDIFTGEILEGTLSKEKREELKKNGLRVSTKRDTNFVEKGIYRLTYEETTEFNPNSVHHMRAAFDQLKLPKVLIRDQATKKRRADSTGKNAIQKILYTKKLSDEQRAFLLAVSAYKEIKKVIGTYYGSLLDEDACFRYYYDMEGARKTGRSSSKKTFRDTGGNSQNLPARTKKDSKLKSFKFKELIIPSVPGNVIVSHDEDSAEAMIVAHLSGAKVLLEEFKKDKPDSHRLYAKFVYEYLTKKSFEELSKDEQKAKRNGMKPCGHGFHYFMSPPTLQETRFMNELVYTPISEIEQVFAALSNLVPEILSWHSRVEQKILTRERWFSVFGRPIQFRGKVEQNSLNELLAKEPQGTIPDINNIMLGFFSRAFREFPEFNGKVINMCHDSLSCEVNENLLGQYEALFRDRAKLIILDYGHGGFDVKWSGGYGADFGEASGDSAQKLPVEELDEKYRNFVIDDHERYRKWRKDVRSSDEISGECELSEGAKGTVRYNGD